MSRRILRATVAAAMLATALATGGCVSWTSGWETSREKPFDPPREMADLRAAVTAAEAEAHDGRGVERLIQAWTNVLRADPDDAAALNGLSSAWTLRGVGYARSIGEKGEFYRKAIQYAERALALDPDFRRKVLAGAEVWEAVDAVPAERADALGWWATALTLYFHEAQGRAVQSTNHEWLGRAERALRRLEALDPTWHAGAIEFARAVAALHLPEDQGGGLRRAGQQIDQAVATHPDKLRGWWARGRWVAPARGEDLRAKTDLEKVAGADARTAPGSFAWNTFLIRDARNALDARNHFLYW